MVLIDYIGIFLHFRILLTDDCVYFQNGNSCNFF